MSTLEPDGNDDAYIARFIDDTSTMSNQEYNREQQRYYAENPNRHHLPFGEYLRERHILMEQSVKFEYVPRSGTPLSATQSGDARRRASEFYESRQTPDASRGGPYAPSSAGAYDRHGPPSTYSTSNPAYTEGHESRHGGSSHHHGESRSHHSRHEGSNHDHGESRSRRDGQGHRTGNGRH